MKYISDWAAQYYGNSKFDLASSGVPGSPGPFPPIFDSTPRGNWNGGEAVEEARNRVAMMHGADPKCVTLTFGGSGAIFMSAFVLARTAPAMIVECPYYEPLWRVFEAIGSEIRFFIRPRKNNYSFKGLYDEARKLTKGASCIMLTNPNNPTGLYDDHEIITELAKAIAPSWLVINEIYRPMHTTVKTVYGVADNVIILGSLTKSYGLGIPRFGWVIAPESIASQFRLAENYIVGGFSGTVAAVIIPVLDNIDKIFEDAHAHIKGRHDMVDNAIRNHKRLSWIRPPGRVILGLVHLDGVKDDLKFAKALLDKHGVVTGPGCFFGVPGTLRLGIGAYAEKFDEGFERFLEFAEEYAE